MKKSWLAATLIKSLFDLQHCIGSQQSASWLSKFRARVGLGNGESRVLFSVKLGQQAWGLMQCVGFSGHSQRPNVKQGTREQGTRECTLTRTLPDTPVWITDFAKLALDRALTKNKNKNGLLLRFIFPLLLYLIKAQIADRSWLWLACLIV